MRRTIILPLLLAVLLVAVGCGDDEPVDTGGTTRAPGSTDGGAGGSDGLDGRVFLSTTVTDGGADRPLVDDTQIRLTFDDGTVGASAGCNTFGGDYTLDGGVLVVTGGAMTEMGCDEPRMAQDEWLFALLGDRPAVALDGDRLTLTAGDVVIELVDEETASPDRPLVGTRWTLESILEGSGPDGSVSNVPEGIEAWIVFADDGTLSVELGCNGGSGSYEVEGDRILVADLASTDIGCDAMSVETAFTAVLQADPTYAVDADRLTLRTDAGGLDFRAEG